MDCVCRFSLSVWNPSTIRHLFDIFFFKFRSENHKSQNPDRYKYIATTDHLPITICWLHNRHVDTRETKMMINTLTTFDKEGKLENHAKSLTW